MLERWLPPSPSPSEKKPNHTSQKIQKERACCCFCSQFWDLMVQLTPRFYYHQVCIITESFIQTKKQVPWAEKKYSCSFFENSYVVSTVFSKLSTCSTVFYQNPVPFISFQPFTSHRSPSRLQLQCNQHLLRKATWLVIHRAPFVHESCSWATWVC